MDHITKHAELRKYQESLCATHKRLTRVAYKSICVYWRCVKIGRRLIQRNRKVLKEATEIYNDHKKKNTQRSQISAPVQRCKNCHWWGRYIEGVCDRIDIDENVVAPNEASMKIDVADDSGLFAKLATGPEFGCTLFTASEASHVNTR